MDVLRRNWKQIDFTLIVTVLLLTAYSCVAIYAATYGKTDPQIPSHAWLKQLIYSLIGFVLMWFIAAFDYRVFRNIHWWLYGVTTVLLLAVFGFHPVNGAHSWITLGGASVQPSEFAKLTLIVSLAAQMSAVDESEFPDYRFRRSWRMWLTLLIPFALTLREPALGQALVMFAVFCTMYTLFAKRSLFAVSMTVFIAFCVAFVALPLEFPTQAADLVQKVLVQHHLLRGYQADRILAWLDTNYQPLGAGYNVRQAQTAIGSGQLFGEGWLSGLETSTGGVPNQWTDYIFSAIGEEFGFVGSSLLVLLFLILVQRLVRAANLSQDTFGTYIAMGLVAMFGFQVFENIGMDMYMSPSTGITLPFISYGGSSLVANYLAIGMVLGVVLRKRKLSFS